MTVGDKLLATTDKGEGRDVPGGGHLDSQVRSKLEAAANRWAATRREAEQQRVSWKTDFTTVSGEEVTPLATAIDVLSDPALDIGVPGEFPYTRGIHPTGYRVELWTMRQFAGYGSRRGRSAHTRAARRGAFRYCRLGAGSVSSKCAAGN